MKSFSRLSLAAAAIASATPAFAADTVAITLTPSAQRVAASGGVVNFFATLTALSDNSASIYLNGDNFNFYGNGNGAGISLNDDGLFTVFPESLAAGESVSGLLFTLLVSPSVGNITYTGIYDLVGGSTDAAQARIGEAAFRVDVAAAAAVPEAATWATMILGMGAVGYALRRRRAVGARAA